MFTNDKTIDRENTLVVARVEIGVNLVVKGYPRKFLCGDEMSVS